MSADADAAPPEAEDEDDDAPEVVIMVMEGRVVEGVTVSTGAVGRA